MQSCSNFFPWTNRHSGPPQGKKDTQWKHSIPTIIPCGLLAEKKRTLFHVSSFTRSSVYPHGTCNSETKAIAETLTVTVCPKPTNLTVKLITLNLLYPTTMEKFHSESSWRWNCLAFDIIHLQMPKRCPGAASYGVQHQRRTPQFRISSIEKTVEDSRFVRNSW